MWDIKYRPLKFTDVLGQEGAVAILKSRLKAGTALNTSYIFSGGHGQGKCVRGDTLVPTDRGLLPIQKLMGEHQIDPINVTVAQESGPAKAAYTYRGGVRKTVRLRTYLGYALEGTPEHRIRVMTSEGVIDWKRLGDLAVGDFACIAPYGFFGQGADLSGYQFEPLPADHSSIPFKPPAFLDGHWGRLMGYLAGDGVCATRTDVSVTCADPEIKEDVLRLLDRLGGSGSETLDRRGSSGNANLRCSRVQLRSFLAYLGVDYVGAAKKTIPWAVLASPEPVVAEFLRAYFEADGSASGFVVEAVTKSPELARQVQVLLLSFGILSRRFPKRHPKYGLYWRVRVRRTSLQKFADRIGFISQRKQEALAAILRGDHTTGRRKLENAYDVVPSQARHVAQLYASLPSDLRSSEAGHFLRCRRGKVACTAKQVGYILHHFPPRLTGHFKILADAGFYYDPVVDLSQGECEVYDLNVPDGEMFAANGFMNHNTTLARILARALLCQNLDKNDPEPCNECDNCRAFLEESCPAYVELDAASKGTIDNVRAIVDDLAFMTLAGSKRIYLFDEVHRMSRDSQDVLLKPLEEKKMVGIFCTTEPEKIRGTIRSRCEEYSIRKINREDVLARMRMILTKEGVEGDDDAILTVIDYCDGHVRDIINKLGMIAQLGPVTLESVRERLSLSMVSTYYEILLNLDNPSVAIELIEKACDRVGPDEAATGMAEAAMNAFRMAHGLFANFVTVDRDLAKRLHQKYGDGVVRLADKFAKARYNTRISLVCDTLATLPQAQAPLPTVQVQMPVQLPVQAAASPTAPKSPAPVAVAPPPVSRPVQVAPPVTGPDVRSDGVGPLGQDPLALTVLDHKATPKDYPRGRSEIKPPVFSVTTPEDVTRILTPDQWRVAFERLWK